MIQSGLTIDGVGLDGCGLTWAIQRNERSRATVERRRSGSITYKPSPEFDPSLSYASSVFEIVQIPFDVWMVFVKGWNKQFECAVLVVAADIWVVRFEVTAIGGRKVVF